MKKLKVLLLILVLVIVAGIGTLIFIYFQNKNSATFLKGTTLNGVEIEGKTPEQAADELLASLRDFSVNITEDGVGVLSGSNKDFGYYLDRDNLIAVLEQELAAEKTDFFAVMRTKINGRTVTVDTAFDFDEDTFRDKVQAANLSVERVASVEASLELNADETEYYIVNPVQGNEIDDSRLQAAVKAAIDAVLSGEVFEESEQQNAENPDAVSAEEALAGFSEDGTIEIAIPQAVYTSIIVNKDLTALEQEMQEKNKALKLQTMYADMSVTYIFGEETEVLDSETIFSWVGYGENDEITVNEEKITEYVSQLADTYNTRGTGRNFTTTNGQNVYFKSNVNMYGYMLDQEGECEQLKADILAAEPVTREPDYYDTNSYGNPHYLSRNGMDDLNGTYVEVNLTAQHVWFYKDGALIVESDCVTGNVALEAETITGVYPLAYKESPSILRGGDAADGYETEVQYWMPFNEGQGLHDASWRGSFGGQIYKTAGSHGCVNLPPSVAKTIYENIKAGTAIVVYK